MSNSEMSNSDKTSTHRQEGAPYRPSNSDDGCAFTDYYCENCKHDNFGFNDEAEGCEILVLALIGEQPKEWIWKNGIPFCTKFEERTEADDRHHPDPDRDPNATQLTLGI